VAEHVGRVAGRCAFGCDSLTKVPELDNALEVEPRPSFPATSIDDIPERRDVAPPAPPASR